MRREAFAIMLHLLSFFLIIGWTTATFSSPELEFPAAVFPNEVKETSDFDSLSPSILRDFPCATLAQLDDIRVQQFARALKRKDVRLRRDQLSCLAERLTLDGILKDFDEFPKDLILFVSPLDYAGSCEEHISRIGKANLELLEKGSPERTRLLSEGLSCLKISGVQVTKEEAEVLGGLVCDLGADYIVASGINLLKELNRCPSFTLDQIKAIRDVLRKGDAPLGPPSEWSSSTLNELTGLIRTFDPNILQMIPKDVLIPWLKQYAERFHMPRKQLQSLVQVFWSKLQSSRQKRDTGECPPDQTITDEMLKDELLPIWYSPEDLKACLKGQRLVESLPTISSYAFTYDQLLALKQNLDQEFPNGYPSSLLPNMGFLMPVTNEEDIKKWNYTSPETLNSLLSVLPEDDMAKLLIERYVDSGGPMNGTALDAIGTRYACLLTQEQLNRIDENALKTATQFNPSKCSQPILENLYPKAKRAFSDRHNEFPAYYKFIQPYLGGAPAEDLRALSKNNVNMDIETFERLKKESVLPLTVKDVRALLGTNLKQLPDHKDNPTIRAWIHNQKQSDLDSLAIALSGGLPNGYINIPRLSRRKKREI
nr:mesothelin [Anolis sagrei ordinatus]